MRKKMAAKKNVLEEFQKEIMEKYLKDGFPSLKEDNLMTIEKRAWANDWGSHYRIEGKSSQHGKNLPEERYQNIYLPHLEFSIETFYTLDYPEKQSELIRAPSLSVSTQEYHKGKGNKMRVKALNDDRYIEVLIPEIPDLFYVINLVNKKFSTIPKIKKEDKGQFKTKVVRTGVYFRVNSESYKKSLMASMKPDHPEAEGVIEQFLETIDTRFSDYKQLKKHFKDWRIHGGIGECTPRWTEWKSLQKITYPFKRRSMHRELFKELKRGFKEYNIDCWMSP